MLGGMTKTGRVIRGALAFLAVLYVAVAIYAYFKMPESVLIGLTGKTDGDHEVWNGESLIIYPQAESLHASASSKFGTSVHNVDELGFTTDGGNRILFSEIKWIEQRRSIFKRIQLAAVSPPLYLEMLILLALLQLGGGGLPAG